MSQLAEIGGHRHGFGKTSRQDRWWIGPMLTVTGLVAWGLYYFWAAWQAKYYHAGPYLSPFYAPLLFAPAEVPIGGVSPTHSAVWFGGTPGWWPSFIPASPALAIFLFPATFRATCYYYRKAYYRSFFGTPPGCAVGPVPHNYRGETGLLVIQNLHRYTLFFAILLLPILFLEAWHSFFLDGQFGVGLGSIIILMNAILLSCYTLGCHAWRHLIGGRLNCFSCDGLARTQHQAWSWSSWLNSKHMRFAWISLYWILSADVFVRLLSMGVIPDINTWGGIMYMSEFSAMVGG